MKRANIDKLRPEYRREYLDSGVRGKYLAAFRSETNLVLLHSDVAKAFPNKSNNRPLGRRGIFRRADAMDYWSGETG